MNPVKALILSSAVSLMGLACWLVMFLAGNDVWNDIGRPDIWNLTSVPFHDVRVFAWIFYFQFVVLLSGVIVPAGLARKLMRRSSGRSGGEPASAQVR